MAWKSGKHRCKCFSIESSSFLYGLRREAPSTERVLLERLLNVLSRAAANKAGSTNPQRLWSESERPDWWAKATKLKWKNPREHPKDNKQALKDKIEVLKQELPKRNLMTPELESELKLHKDSKKIDLELKSDLEAVIAKSSGLHFMVDKVAKKMGQSKVISEKVATYIKEIMLCLDHCHVAIKKMHDKVELGEKRRSSLWEQMGVKKQKTTSDSDHQALPDDDLEPDALVIDDVDWGDETLEHAQDAAVVMSPPTPPPVPTNYEDSDIMAMIRDQGVLEQQQVRTIGGMAFQRQVYVGDPGPSSVYYQRSLSQPAPKMDDVVIDLSGRQIRVSDIELSPRPMRKARRVSDEEDGSKHDDSGRTVVRLPQQVPMSAIESIIIEDTDDEVEQLGPHGSVPGLRPTESDSGKRKMRVKQSRERQAAYDRSKSLGGHKRSALMRMSNEDASLRSRTFPYTCHSAPIFTQLTAAGLSSDFKVLQRRYGMGDDQESPVTVSPWLSSTTVAGGTTFTTATSVKFAGASSPLAADDLVEDGTGEETLEVHNMEDVDYILEESSGTPTVGMYMEEDARSNMDQLAEMTKALSCDDLSATVTEYTMQGIQSSGQHHQHHHQQQHQQPQQQHQQQQPRILVSDSGFYRLHPTTLSGPSPISSHVVFSVSSDQAGKQWQALPQTTSRIQAGPLMSLPLQGQGQSQSHGQSSTKGRQERSLSQAIADYGDTLP